MFRASGGVVVVFVLGATAAVVYSLAEKRLPVLSSKYRRHPSAETDHGQTGQVRRLRRRHIRVLFLLRDTPGEDHTGHVRHTGRKVHVLAVAGVRAVRGQLCVRAARAQSVPRREPRHDEIGVLRRQRGHVLAGHDLQQHGATVGQLSHSGWWTEHYKHTALTLDQRFSLSLGVASVTI